MLNTSIQISPTLSEGGPVFAAVSSCIIGFWIAVIYEAIEAFQLESLFFSKSTRVVDSAATKRDAQS